MGHLSTPEAVSLFIEILKLLVIPAVIYVVKSIHALDRKVDKINTVLIGVDGKNGLRSRIRRLEIKVDALAFAQAHRHGESSHGVPTNLFPDHDDTDEE